MSAKQDLLQLLKDLGLKAPGPFVAQTLAKLEEEVQERTSKENAAVIREYLKNGEPPPGHSLSTGLIWYRGGLEKAANLIDPDYRESEDVR